MLSIRKEADPRVHLRFDSEEAQAGCRAEDRARGQRGDYGSYYFNDVRRKATQDAGKIAGLNVIDIINEPTAATLAYAWMKGELGRPDRMARERTIMVYDLGGGTFDVTVVRYNATNFRVLATDGDVMLGGIDWTRRVVDHVAEQFHRKYNDDPRSDPETLMMLTQECEQAKRDLSDKSQTPITVYHKGKSLTVAISRSDFERMTADLMQRTRDTTELVMQQAGVGIGELDDCVLVGGSTYMPAVEIMLKETTGLVPSRDVVKPEEAVAQERPCMQPCSKPAPLVMRPAWEGRFGSPEVGQCQRRQLALAGVKITDPNNRQRKINHIMIRRTRPCPPRSRSGS